MRRVKGDKLDESDEMRLLRELDEGAEWELEGDLLAANDRPETGPEEDDGMAGVPAVPHLYPIDGGAEEGLDAPETTTNIINTLKDMVRNGAVEDLLVIVNTPDGEQLLMTTLERNDHIIGMLSVATMNWHSSQIAMQNYLEEEE